MSEDKTPMQEYIESKPALHGALMEMGTLFELCDKWNEWRKVWKYKRVKERFWQNFMLLVDNEKWKCPICLNTYNAANAAKHFISFLEGDFRTCQRGFYKRTARPIPSSIKARQPIPWWAKTRGYRYVKIEQTERLDND